MIPAMLAANPRLDRWVGFEPDGRARIAFGRMEYGQGVGTSLAQMAADELDVPFARLRVVPAATGDIPDEGLTVGSMSTEVSGPAIRAACAEVRALFTAAAAGKLGCQAADLDVRDGAFLRDGQATGLDYWSLAAEVDLAREATGEAPLKTPGQMRIVGESQPRLDLPPKLFGAAFLHDLTLPGMRHARVLRQPTPQARLKSLDEAAIRRAAPPGHGGAIGNRVAGQCLRAFALGCPLRPVPVRRHRQRQCARPDAPRHRPAHRRHHLWLARRCRGG